ncbi:hypothetical protein [Methylobacterium marchantiae]|uniref:Uncharacterized protein n=1 Tax=Methylobacterium marchantiae TaxID=600331 RepID=A0ABW3X3A9_9HYPH|nr:hypothetical protein AIGOOFII_0281 [Methylobacterium marchantiae]
MTITVTLNSLGILKAIAVVTNARADASPRAEAEPRWVSVNVGASTVQNSSGRPAGQDRIVDVMV